MTISRRDFVKGSLAGVLSAGAAGQNFARSFSPLMGKIEKQADAEKYARYRDWVFIDALGGIMLDERGLEDIKKSGVTMIETTLGAPGDPPFSYEQAVKDCSVWHGIFDTMEDRLIRVKTVKDIREAKKAGKLALMIGFQNGTHLNRDIDNVKFFYDLGIRQIQLTYNSLNYLGAGCTERRDVGLSDFGVQVVAKMNELGMLVDLSHCGVKTTLDSIEASAKPVLFTHTNCEALCNNPRGKSDEEIKKLAAKGGVMGITTVNFFVSKKPRSTLDDYIAHIEYVAKLVGIDHVGIGTDSAISGWRPMFPTEKAFFDYHAQYKFKPEVDLRWPPFIEELDVPEKMYIIADRLAQRGFSAEDIQKVMGGNFMRVYEEVIG